VALKKLIDFIHCLLDWILFHLWLVDGSEQILVVTRCNTLVSSPIAQANGSDVSRHDIQAIVPVYSSKIQQVLVFYLYTLLVLAARAIRPQLLLECLNDSLDWLCQGFLCLLSPVFILVFYYLV